jgi:hypothetical protein
VFVLSGIATLQAMIVLQPQAASGSRHDPRARAVRVDVQRDADHAIATLTYVHDDALRVVPAVAIGRQDDAALERLPAQRRESVPERRLPGR